MTEGKAEKLDDVDVIVIGGGVSGLFASKQILERKKDFSLVVLEASNRVGGRTFSQETKHGVTIDLGGQWVGNTHPRLAQMVKDLGLKLHPQFHTGKKIMDIFGRVMTYTSDIPTDLSSGAGTLEVGIHLMRLERLAAQMDVNNPAQHPQARDLDNLTVAEWCERNLFSQTAKALFEVLTRAVFGSEPAEVSMLQMLTFAKSSGNIDTLIKIPNGHQESTVLGGMSQISAALARQVEALGGHILLDNPVEHIDYSAFSRAGSGEGSDGASPKRVVVRTPTRRLSARYVVVAMAPLAAGKIRYTPLLPTVRDHLHYRAFMGCAIKVLAFYKTAFWREKGLSGEVVCDCLEGPIHNAYDHSLPKVEDGKESLQPALVGFINADAARLWSARPVEERKQAVLQQFARWFGAEALNPIDYFERDWTQDPFCRGCPTGVHGPAALWSAGHILRQPVGPLHWAGTELALKHPGYIEGALESGQHAADQIIKCEEDSEDSKESAKEPHALAGEFGGEYGAGGKLRRKLPKSQLPWLKIALLVMIAAVLWRWI